MRHRQPLQVRLLLHREGFVHNDLKVTLENLYRLQHDVLHNKVDAILWDIVKEQKVIH